MQLLHNIVPDSIEQHRGVKVPPRILPIPPAPAVFDQRVVDVRSVRQEHVSKSSPVLVETVSLERDFFSKDQL